MAVITTSPRHSSCLWKACKLLQYLDWTWTFLTCQMRPASQRPQRFSSFSAHIYERIDWKFKGNQSIKSKTLEIKFKKDPVTCTYNNRETNVINLIRRTQYIISWLFWTLLNLTNYTILLTVMHHIQSIRKNTDCPCRSKHCGAYIRTRLPTRYGRSPLRLGSMECHALGMHATIPCQGMTSYPSSSQEATPRDPCNQMLGGIESSSFCGAGSCLIILIVIFIIGVINKANQWLWKEWLKRYCWWLLYSRTGQWLKQAWRLAPYAVRICYMDR